MTALTMSRVAPQARTLLTSLLLIEIGQSFGTSIGITSQINTINSALAILSALMMGLLSVKYPNRGLLLTGLTIIIIASAGCCIAPSFVSLLFLYSLGGFGANMVIPMTSTLIGEHIAPEKRTQVLSWLLAGPAALYLLGYQYVDYLGDWKLAYMYFALPLTLIALFLTTFAVPKSNKIGESRPILEGYQSIIKNRSALSALVGYGLSLGVWQISLALSASFYREVLGFSRSYVSFLISFMAISYIVGTQLASRVVKRWGRRKTAIFSLLFLAFFSMFRYMFLTPIIAITFGFFTCLTSGLCFTNLQGLNLEQVPDFRGSMMSLTSAFGSVGNVVALSLAGALLIGFNWSSMGLIVGSLGIFAALLVYRFVMEVSI
jgi:predicted MFS family arabinose efflux permease